MSHPGAPALAPPAPVRRAVLLSYVVVGVNLVATAAGLAIGAAEVGAAGVPGLDEGFLGAVTALTVAVTVVVALLGAALRIVCAVFTAKGHNWARIVLTVLAGLAVLGLLLSLLGLALSGLAPDAPRPAPLTTAVSTAQAVLSAALQVAVVVLLFRPVSNAFFREAAARRTALAGRPA